MHYAPQEFLAEEVELDGVTKTVREWCDERKLPYNRAYTRRKKHGTWAESLDPMDRTRKNRERIRDTDWAIGKAKGR